MPRIFKEVPSFTKKWQELGLDDDDLRTLEEILLKNRFNRKGEESA